MSEILSDAELLRYNRQIVLKSFDFEGQEALKQAAVLVIGAGGLGCAVAQYLAVSGVGQLTLVDYDKVELSNLQRQVLHNDGRLGQSKVESAATALRELNPYVRVSTIPQQADEVLLDTLLPLHNLVLDCSDNVVTRNLMSRRARAHRVPLVSGAAIRFEGQVCSFLWHDNEPCYECLSQLFGDQALSCVEAGILAPLVGLVGSIQALEAIKLLASVGEPLTHRMLLIDGLSGQFRTLRLPKRAGCPGCATHPPEL